MFLGVGRGTFDAAPGNLRLQKTVCAVILTVPPKDTLETAVNSKTDALVQCRLNGHPERAAR